MFDWTASDYYPPLGTRFRVDFDKIWFMAVSPKGFGFQTISGIESELEYEEIAEGGENMFYHRLPKRMRYKNLTLKRGLEVLDFANPLVSWCMDTLTQGISGEVEPIDVTINLLDADGFPMATWRYINAWPTRWAVSDLNSMETEVLIEEIELCYQYGYRLDSGLIGAAGRVNNLMDSNL